MANQRPIRRGRIPFRRGRRWTSSLQRRWLDGYSTRAVGTDQCTQQVLDVFCDPSPPARVVLYGDTDWDWADASEVRIDRILGSISWDSMAGVETNNFAAPNHGDLRLGLLALEEWDGTTATAPVIDLFDAEALEEYQWMWLYHSQGHVQRFPLPTTPMSMVVTQYDNIDVDVRTRRKLGKKDGVVLYAQYKYHSSSANEAGTLTLIPRVTYQLRAIIRS